MTKSSARRLAGSVDWSFFEQRFGASYTDRAGRPAAAADAADGGPVGLEAHL
jgi:hypothetical protein